MNRIGDLEPTRCVRLAMLGPIGRAYRNLCNRAMVLRGSCVRTFWSNRLTLVVSVQAHLDLVGVY